MDYFFTLNKGRLNSAIFSTRYLEWWTINKCLGGSMSLLSRPSFPLNFPHLQPCDSPVPCFLLPSLLSLHRLHCKDLLYLILLKYYLDLRTSVSGVGLSSCICLYEFSAFLIHGFFWDILPLLAIFSHNFLQYCFSSVPLLLHVCWVLSPFPIYLLYTLFVYFIFFSFILMHYFPTELYSSSLILSSDMPSLVKPTYWVLNFSY